MRRIHYSLVLSILYLTVIFGQNSKTYKVNTIAFYNLENLFDTVDDPNKKIDIKAQNKQNTDSLSDHFDFFLNSKSD